MEENPDVTDTNVIVENVVILLLESDYWVKRLNLIKKHIKKHYIVFC